MNGTPVVLALMLLVALSVLACAREGIPPGGPRDIIPPYVIESDPPAGSTGVPVDAIPTLTFNERIEPRSIAGNVFIAPIVEFDAETNWRGNQVRIRFEEPLQGDRTYIITVGTGIRDQRGNRMDSTFVYALSTGSHIGRGVVSGLVVHDGRNARGAYIWAYSLSGKPDPDPAGTPPDYLTQAGTDGTFSFTHLSADHYRFFAFLDQGRDRLYDPGADPIGVPDRDVVLSQEELEHGPLVFRLAVNDTASMHVVSARPSHKRELHVLLSEAPREDHARDTGFYAIRSAEEDGEALEVTTAYRDLSDSTALVLITAPQVRGRAYRLAVTGLENNWGEPMDTTRNTAEFTGSSFEDSSPPQILEVDPDDRSQDIAPSTEIRFAFSEAVTLEENALALLDSTGGKTDVEIRWVSPTVVAMRPDSLLWPSAEYGIRILPAGVKNGSGQSMETTDDLADTLEYTFTTIDPADYGSLSGRFEDGDTEGAGPVGISLFLARETDPALELELSDPGDFRFDNVLPGRYILQAYRDTNDNGRYDFGTTVPFKPSERSVVHPDTVEVRSGWETEDILIILGP